MAEDRDLELDREELLANEDTILSGLLEAAERQKEPAAEIVIKRHNKTLFTFRVRPLSDEEFEECRDKATTYKRNHLGIRVPHDTDPSMYRTLVIYRATIEEDRKKLWDNKAYWQQLGVASGLDMIDKVLLAGEKAEIVDRIEELSGYGADLEKLAKN